MHDEILLKIIKYQTIAMLAAIQKVIDDDDLTDSERVAKIGRILVELPDISN